MQNVGMLGKCECVGLKADEPEVKLNTLIWRLRPGVMIRIDLPEKLTNKDVEKIKAFLDLEF